ncbi:hypothetical protein B0H13DRAFT_1872525 [Mycena leptocephala]|nr:hypothetical protein B0H13DRAFT_1872525 [Mycena leptocephala]
MERLAWTYHEVGQFRQAKVLRFTVLEERRTILGMVIQAPCRLCLVLQQHITNWDSMRSQQSSKSQHWKSRGDIWVKITQTLCYMGNLAGTYRELGRFTQAEALELEVLEKRRHLLATYGTQARFDEAQTLLVSVLDRQRKLLGEDHQVTLLTMGNLAWIYHSLGQMHKAEALEVLVLEKRRELLGEDHPDTLRSMGDLATIYHNLGQYMQAEALCARALEKYRKLLGEDHPETIRITRNLAGTYHRLDKVPEAEELERLVAYHEV